MEEELTTARPIAQPWYKKRTRIEGQVGSEKSASRSTQRTARFNSSAHTRRDCQRSFPPFALDERAGTSLSHLDLRPLQVKTEQQPTTLPTPRRCGPTNLPLHKRTRLNRTSTELSLVDPHLRVWGLGSGCGPPQPHPTDTGGDHPATAPTHIANSGVKPHRSAFSVRRLPNYPQALAHSVPLVRSSASRHPNQHYHLQPGCRSVVGVQGWRVECCEKLPTGCVILPR